MNCNIRFENGLYQQDFIPYLNEDNKITQSDAASFPLVLTREELLRETTPEWVSPEYSLPESVCVKLWNFVFGKLRSKSPCEDLTFFKMASLKALNAAWLKDRKDIEPFNQNDWSSLFWDVAASLGEGAVVGGAATIFSTPAGGVIAGGSIFLRALYSRSASYNALVRESRYRYSINRRLVVNKIFQAYSKAVWTISKNTGDILEKALSATKIDAKTSEKVKKVHTAWKSTVGRDPLVSWAIEEVQSSIQGIGRVVSGFKKDPKKVRSNDVVGTVKVLGLIGKLVENDRRFDVEEKLYRLRHQKKVKLATEDALEKIYWKFRSQVIEIRKTLKVLGKTPLKDVIQAEFTAVFSFVE